MGMVMHMGMTLPRARVMRMGTIMVVVMPSATGGIGAAHGHEGRADIRHRGAERLEHGADYVITQDQNAILTDLRGEMPVADMPSQLEQVNDIPRPDVKQVFLGGPDQNAGAVIQHQCIAMLQNGGLGQVDQDLAPVIQLQDTPPDMARVVGQ